MRIPLAAAALAALLGIGGPSAAAGTRALDLLREAVAARGATVDSRALDRALLFLDAPRVTVLEELETGERVLGILERAFPRDPDLGPALEAAVAGLREEMHAVQISLAGWAGRTGSERGQRIVERGLERFNACVARSTEEGRTARRVRHLVHAVLAVHRALEALDLPPPSLEPPPFVGLAPEFSLLDENPNSASAGRPVAPGDHRPHVTAWYFVRST
jgi:hypothetical protein